MLSRLRRYLAENDPVSSSFYLLSFKGIWSLRVSWDFFRFYSGLEKDRTMAAIISKWSKVVL